MNLATPPGKSPATKKQRGDDGDMPDFSGFDEREEQELVPDKGKSSMPDWAESFKTDILAGLGCVIDQKLVSMA